MAEELLPHSAAATWSGFIYQGRIALYHVLKLLHDNSEEELAKLNLQIDSIEDFTIIKFGPDNSIIPITMHQIKAVKSNYYSTYKDDFKQLEDKKEQTGVEDVESYFHLSTKNEKTKEQIEVLHKSLKIYCYENDQEFCSLNEIDGMIKSNLVLACQKHGINGHENPETMQLLYDILEKVVSDRVVYIHSLNQSNGIAIRNAAYENPIPLLDFLNAIRQDIAAIVQDEKYFEAKIKSNLNRYYQEFCVEVDEEDLTDEIKIKMGKYLYLFNSFKFEKFKTFLQSIRPNKEIRYTNLEEYTDRSLLQDEVKDTFLVTLMEIKESNNSQGIGWKCSELKQYFPTTITQSSSEENKKRACNRIMKTALSTMLDVPFNADYLITSECNVDSIQLYANKISDVDPAGNEEIAKWEDKVTNWRKIGLIDLETAKNKLND